MKRAMMILAAVSCLAGCGRVEPAPSASEATAEPAAATRHEAIGGSANKAAVVPAEPPSTASPAPAAKTSAATGPAATVPDYGSLARGLKVLGTMARAYKSETVLMNRHLSYRQWETDFELVNGTGQPVDLGEDLVLIESNATGALVDGIAVFREGPTSGAATADLYDVSNVQSPCFARNEFLLRWADVFSFGGSGAEKDVDYFAVKTLEPGQSHRFRLTLRMGRWIEDKDLASVRVALPEIRFGSGHGAVRFRYVAYFQVNGAKWTFAREEIIPLRRAELTELLVIPETNPITRNFAANWLAEVDPDGAKEPLLRVASTLHDGSLLYTCLVRLTALKAVGLADHARSLLTNGEGPNGIRRQAALYLGTVRDEASASSLIAAAADKDDKLALGAISALGSLGGPQANDALRRLLADSERSSHHQQIAAALLTIKNSATVKELEGLAETGQKAVMDALAEAGLPETFAFFSRLADAPNRDRWVASLAVGLGKSGKDRAIPLLLKMVKDENKDTRHAAASALESLTPGPFSAEYVEAALASADESVIYNLLCALNRAEWTDPAAVRRLGNALKSCKDSLAAWELIEMLQRTSGVKTGPKDFSAFVEDKDSWTRKWVEWSAQH